MRPVRYVCSLVYSAVLVLLLAPCGGPNQAAVGAVGAIASECSRRTEGDGDVSWATVSGTAKTLSGDPLRNWTMSVSVDDIGASDLAEVWGVLDAGSATSTDDHGRFSARVLCHGASRAVTVSVTARFRTIKGSQGPVILSCMGTTDIGVVVVEDAPVVACGRVVDEGGRPVAEARVGVRLTWPYDGVRVALPSILPELTAVADGQGQFELRAVMPDRWYQSSVEPTLVAEASGFSSAEVPLRIEATNYQLVLGLACALTIRLRETAMGDGMSVEVVPCRVVPDGVRVGDVVFVPNHRGRCWTWRYTPASDGVIDLYPLSCGEYTLRLLSVDGRVVRSRVVLVSGDADVVL